MTRIIDRDVFKEAKPAPEAIRRIVFYINAVIKRIIGKSNTGTPIASTVPLKGKIVAVFMGVDIPFVPTVMRMEGIP